MSEQYRIYFFNGNAQGLQLPVNFFFSFYREFILSGIKPFYHWAGKIEIVPIANIRVFAGVDHEYSFGMLNNHYPDWQPSGIFPVEHKSNLRQQPGCAGIFK